MLKSTSTTTSRSDALPDRMDVIYEQMRRKSVAELRGIVTQVEQQGGHRGRWYTTAKAVLKERLEEVRHGR